MLTLLYLGARLFENKYLFWLSEMIRVIEGQLWVFVLNTFLPGKWILRHSATTPGSYNPFYSDFDWDLILPEDGGEFEKAIRNYKSLKKFFIFLGEVESYTETEHQSKKELQTKFPSLFALSRSLRKLNWMIAAYRSANHPYHRSKALRAIRKLKLKIREHSQIMKQHLWQLESSDSPHFKSVISAFYGESLFGRPGNFKNYFVWLTSVDLPVLCVSRNQWENLVLPIYQMEALEYQAYLRSSQESWSASNQWLEKVRQEVNSSSSLREHLPLRFETHLANELTSAFLPSESRPIYVGDELLEVWMKHNLPQAKLQKLPYVSNRGLMNSKDKKVSRITFWGETTDRYGLDIFFHALLLLGDLHSDPQSLEVEIPFPPQRALSREGLRRFILNAKRLKFPLFFSDQPTGVLVLPYRYNYVREFQWTEAAKTWDLPMICGDDPEMLAREVLKKLV